MDNAYACNIVIDLEFTPVPKAMRRKGGLQFEIIEVGAVKVAPDGTIAGESSHMVKPCYATGVSGVVHHITGIGDEDLTCARPLGEVLDALSAWIGSERARMVTWSDCDLRQISKECTTKGIDAALPTRWLDIQRLYPQLMGMENHRRKIALGEAADWLGIANERTSAHRALYDAQVTAEIFRMMAAGECEEHRERIMAELDSTKDEPVCTASIADRCGGLGELLAMLKSQEGRNAA
jgi:inhibitor of KinA sporulation pathway (predicted exonuclease)